MNDRSERAYLAASEVPAQPGPPGPEIASVDDTCLTVLDTTRATRWWLTLPMAGIMLIFPVLFILDRVSAWHEARVEWVAIMEERISVLGENAVLNRLAEADGGGIFKYIWPDRELTFFEYLHYVWSRAPGGWQNEAWMTGFAGLFLLAALIGLWMGLGGRRFHRLVFDRERKAVYTWRKGRLLVKPWAASRVACQTRAVTWMLTDVDGLEKPVPVFLGASALSPANTEDQTRHIGRIRAFMDNGPSAIEDAPFEKCDPFSLRVDPVPEDLHHRIDAALRGI